MGFRKNNSTSMVTPSEVHGPSRLRTQVIVSHMQLARLVRNRWAVYVPTHLVSLRYYCIDS
jgi:hypothetical protein